MSKTRGKRRSASLVSGKRPIGKHRAAHCTAPLPRLNAPPNAPQLPSGRQRHGDPPTLLRSLRHGAAPPGNSLMSSKRPRD